MDPPRLVFISRVDPPLPVARWRVGCWLAEVRQPDLAFTVPEAALLFAALGEHRLSTSDVEGLWRHTEGWVAGLRLAATAIRDHPDASVAAREFYGENRLVADLLVSEILDRQSVELSEFLLRTSIVDVLDGELCDALTGRYDSSTVLWSLEADLAFLTATSADRSRYRCHPLLAEMLRAELARRRPGAAPGLHRVAAEVLEGRGDMVDAVLLLLAAGETDRAFSLAFTTAFQRFDRGDVSAAVAWIDLFPRELAAGSAFRMLTYALALGMADRPDDTVAWMERAALRLADDPQPQAKDAGTLDALRLLAFTVTATGDHGVEAGRRALEAIDRGVDLGILGARVRPNLARAYLLVNAPEQAETILPPRAGRDLTVKVTVKGARCARVAMAVALRAALEQ